MIETQTHGSGCCLTRTHGHGWGLSLYKSLGLIKTHDNVRPMANNGHGLLLLDDKIQTHGHDQTQTHGYGHCQTGTNGHGRALSL